VLTVAAVLKIGGATLDETLSARRLARELARVEAGNLPTAVFQVPRETEYSLAFYRDQEIESYDRSAIPPRDHLLITREGFKPETTQLLASRRVSFLGNFRAKLLEYYWVSAPGMVHEHERNWHLAASGYSQDATPSFPDPLDQRLTAKCYLPSGALRI